MYKKKDIKPNKEVAQMLAQFTKQIKDLQDQIDFVLKKKEEDGGASKLIADMAYNTPADRLLEYSVVSNSAIDPFALAFACGAVLNPEVLSGKVSLCEIYLEKVLRLQRGKGGKLLGYAADQAKEEAQKTAESTGEGANLGQGL